MLIEFFKARRNSGLRLKPLSQEFRAKCMDRSNMSFFEPRTRLLEIMQFAGIRHCGSGLVEFNSKSKAQLTCSFAGKGDGDDLVDPGASGPDHINDAFDQFGCLARAGTRRLDN